MGTPVLIDHEKEVDAIRATEASLLAALPGIPAALAFIDADMLLKFADSLERISRAVSFAQAAVAVEVQERNLAADPERHFEFEAPATERSQFRNTPEFLRARFQISKSEAQRRLLRGQRLLPQRTLTGNHVAAEYTELARGAVDCSIDTEGLQLAIRALDEAKSRTSTAVLGQMESNLLHAAAQHDPDFLRPIIQRWNTIIDQDGAEPTEEELNQRQGIWRMRSQRGLNHFQIWADQPQTEVLLTVMHAGANPRSQTIDERHLDARSLPQKHLDAMTGALKAALRTDELPATGGARPQVHVTVGFKELLASFGTDRLGSTDRLNGTGERGNPHRPSGAGQPNDAAQLNGTGEHGSATMAFTGPINARNIRSLACDADIIPIVLGGAGQVLDVGAGNRFFSRAQRSALVARDRGCSFPRCTVPASWCEAHHVDWWSRNPWTAVDNGALLCSHHHHLIHQERWSMQMRNGIPWFIPPPWIDPNGMPIRNTFHQI